MVATRSAPGVVYTPRDVCEPMVRLAVEPLLGGDVRKLRVCDPAIGEGAFLIEIVRALSEPLIAQGVPRPRARRLVAAHCLHGIDIDARAVRVARTSVEDFVGARVPELAEHLRVGDALAASWPQRFDVVVGNPPYVRQELIANKAALRDYAAYDGVADLYVYFIELAHRIGDRFCFVVPSKWMTAAYGRPLRKLLARKRSIEGVVDFARGLPMFGDADAFPCIVWGTSAGAVTALRAARARTSVSEALASAPPTSATWTAEPWHIDDPDDAALIDRMTARWPTLAQVVPERPSRGIITGCNRAFVIDAATRSRLLAAEPAAAPLVRPLLKGRDVRRWQPAPIERYVLLVDRGTSLAKLPELRRHLEQFRGALEPRPDDHEGPWRGRKPGSYRWYELQDPVVPLATSRAPRLFYQDIQTEPACCLDPTGELVPDTTVWILPSADPFLLAVLNSPLYAWYARRRFPPALNGAVRPKLEYIRALPIATPRRALNDKIAGLVALQLRDATAARDTELANLVCDAYELSPADRAGTLRG